MPFLLALLPLLPLQSPDAFPDPRTGRAPRYEVRQTLSLEPAPAPGAPPTLVIETRRSGALGGPPSTTRTAYQRN